MERNHKFIELQKRAVELNERITAENIDAIVSANYHLSMESTLHLQHTLKDVARYGLTDCSDDKIMEEARLLSEPRYVQIKEACVDLIDNENIYLDKITKVIIIAITRNGAKLENGKDVEVERLFLKED